jgi:hypothetical protein
MSLNMKLFVPGYGKVLFPPNLMNEFVLDKLRCVR